jgi:hypothetical protein
MSIEIRNFKGNGLLMFAKRLMMAAEIFQIEN